MSSNYTDRKAFRAYIAIFVVSLVVFLPYVQDLFSAISIPAEFIALANGTAASMIAVYFAVKRETKTAAPGTPSTFGLRPGVVRLILLVLIGIGILIGIAGEAINWAFIGTAAVSIITWAYPET